jgi:ribose transport system substrate-binding protein
MECGANKEAKKLGVNLTITGPGNFDPTLQIPIVNGVIAKHPDGIIMAPTDTTALIPPMKQMVSQGIKVVQVDTAVTDKSIAVSSLTSDNFAAGQQAMDLLAKALDGKTGSVLLIDNAPSASATIARGDGVVEQAKKYPNIKLLPRQFDHNQSSNDPKIMDATLSAHPDLIGVIGTYNNAVIGAIPSLKAAGKLGTVKVVTFDADSKLIELVKSGEIYATLAQQVEKMGSMAVGNMVQALNGQQPEKEVALDMVPITQSNVDTPESKALYYPESFDAARC